MFISQPEDLEKMKKRAERFGIVVSNKLSKVSSRHSSSNVVQECVRMH